MAATGWSHAVASVLAAAVAMACCCAAVVDAVDSRQPAAMPSWAAAVFAASTLTPSSLDCGTVTSLLAGCAAFVRHGATAAAAAPDELELELLLPAPGTPCCDGVAGLYAVAADSPDNWRAVCGCMAGLVRRHSSNASAIALLPGLCGVSLGAAAADHTFAYCRR